MHFNVCLFCGKSGCRCSGGPGQNRWRAPVVSLRDASRMEIPPGATVVFGRSENFDTIWGGDPDWSLALETM